jgi:hypothetical protein
MPRGHFVPEFYLANFSDPDRDPYIWVMFPDRPGWHVRKPGSAFARRKDMYGGISVRRSPGRAQEMEDALQQVETAAANIIRKKVVKQRSISARERSDLAFFFGTMWMRVPSQHERIHSFVSEHGQRMLDARLLQMQRDPALLNEEKARFREKTGISADGFSNEDCVPGKYKLAIPMQEAISTALGLAPAIASQLSRMGWMFAVTREPDWFVTSDHPFCILDSTKSPPTEGVGLRSPNVEITLPLSRNIALIASWRHTGERWRLFGARMAEEVNCRTVRSASRFVAAPKAQFPGSQQLRGVQGYRPSEPT